MKKKKPYAGCWLYYRQEKGGECSWSPSCCESFQWINSPAKICDAKARTCSTKQRGIMKSSNPFSSCNPTATSKHTKSVLPFFIAISSGAKDFGVVVSGGFLRAHLPIASLLEIAGSKHTRLGSDTAHKFPHSTQAVQKHTSSCPACSQRMLWDFSPPSSSRQAARWETGSLLSSCYRFP